MLDPTSLDAEQSEVLETKSHAASDDVWSTSRYQRMVFGSLLPAQHRLASLLFEAADAAIADPDLHQYAKLGRVADNLLDCAKTPWISFDKDSVQFKISEFRCRSRLCTRCAITRSEILRASLRPLVKEFNAPKLLTLTLKSSEDPLKDQIRHIIKSFANLRRSKLWQSKFVGGIYTIEVTHNRRTDLWHPHIHAVIDGKFCLQSELVEAWKKASGGSYVVDIRAANDRNKALEYITKYVTKTNDASRVPDHKVAEWAVAVRGMRFISTFGTMRGKKLIDDDEYEPIERNQLTTLSHLEKAANFGDEKADLLWHAVVKEAHRGALPDDLDLKALAIERRFSLYSQLTLWIDDWARPPDAPDPDSSQDPPTPKHFPDGQTAMFSLRPSSGDQ